MTPVSCHILCQNSYIKKMSECGDNLTFSIILILRINQYPGLSEVLENQQVLFVQFVYAVRYQLVRQ